jgi:hypothetical protein
MSDITKEAQLRVLREARFSRADVEAEKARMLERGRELLDREKKIRQEPERPQQGRLGRPPKTGPVCKRTLQRRKKLSP